MQNLHKISLKFREIRFLLSLITEGNQNCSYCQTQRQIGVWVLGKTIKMQMQIFYFHEKPLHYLAKVQWVIYGYSQHIYLHKINTVRLFYGNLFYGATVVASGSGTTLISHQCQLHPMDLPHQKKQNNIASIQTNAFILTELKVGNLNLNSN